MSATEPDVIDTLVGITPGSPLDAIRARRPEARSQAQASFAALFAPHTPGDFSVAERFALATFVAGLHAQPALVSFYAAKLAGAGAAPALRDAVSAAAADAAGQGPYGAYPNGPLSAEDTEGPVWYPVGALAEALGPRLAAAFVHAHMLVFHPRDSTPEFLRALLDAGWSTTDIVTISQLVAFLSFQIRVVAGLSTLAARS